MFSSKIQCHYLLKRYGIFTNNKTLTDKIHFTQIILFVWSIVAYFSHPSQISVFRFLFEYGNVNSHLFKFSLTGYPLYFLWYSGQFMNNNTFPASFLYLMNFLNKLYRISKQRNSFLQCHVIFGKLFFFQSFHCRTLFNLFIANH